jgi:hypothetical protein
MRLGRLALPMLIALPACSPVRDYQEAARSLTFTLDRVEPRLQLAFPLDRSRLALDLTLGVHNPSNLPFHIQSFQGEVRLDTGSGAQPLGQLGLARALDLPAGGNAQLEVSVEFAYRDLERNWPGIQAAVRGGAAGSWELAGTLGADVYGVPLRLPVRTRQAFGGGR